MRTPPRLPAPALPVLVLALGLAAWPMAGLPSPIPLLPPAAAAVALAAASLSGLWPGGLAWSLGLLAAEYVLSLELRPGGLDPAAPAYGAALLLFAELGWLALEARAGSRPWPGRLLTAAALALGGAALGWALLAVATLPVAGGLGLTALGAAAAVAAAGALARAARARRA